MLARARNGSRREEEEAERERERERAIGENPFGIFIMSSRRIKSVPAAPLWPDQDTRTTDDRVPTELLLLLAFRTRPIDEKEAEQSLERERESRERERELWPSSSLSNFA